MKRASRGISVVMREQRVEKEISSPKSDYVSVCSIRSAAIKHVEQKKVA
jgi:hypothetical protein